MISLGAPDKATAGSRYCVTATGFTGDLSARVTVDGVALPAKVTVDHGVATICVKIPSGAEGAGLRLRVADSKGNDRVHNAIVTL